MVKPENPYASRSLEWMLLRETDFLVKLSDLPECRCSFNRSRRLGRWFEPLFRFLYGRDAYVAESEVRTELKKKGISLPGDLGNEWVRRTRRRKYFFKVHPAPGFFANAPETMTAEVLHGALKERIAEVLFAVEERGPERRFRLNRTSEAVEIIPVPAIIRREHLVLQFEAARWDPAGDEDPSIFHKRIVGLVRRAEAAGVEELIHESYCLEAYVLIKAGASYLRRWTTSLGRLDAVLGKAERLAAVAHVLGGKFKALLATKATDKQRRGFLLEAAYRHFRSVQETKLARPVLLSGLESEADLGTFGPGVIIRPDGATDPLTHVVPTQPRYAATRATAYADWCRTEGRRSDMRRLLSEARMHCDSAREQLVDAVHPLANIEVCDAMARTLASIGDGSSRSSRDAHAALERVEERLGDARQRLSERKYLEWTANSWACRLALAKGKRDRTTKRDRLILSMEAYVRVSERRVDVFGTDPIYEVALKKELSDVLSDIVRRVASEDVAAPSAGTPRQVATRPLNSSEAKEAGA